MAKHTLNTPAAQTTMSMVRYETAIRALAECKAVDEVKAWSDKAAALQAYGRMAKDKTLEVDAAEIRIRAERRLGEMIAAQKETVGLNPGVKLAGKNQDGSSALVTDEDRKPTLADAGISYDLSSRAQKLAAVPEEEFEKEVGDWRERVQEEGKRVTARLEQAGEREIKKAKPGECPSCQALREQLDELISSQQAGNEEFQAMVRICDADDRLVQSMAEVKRLSEMNRVLTERLNGKMSECHALTQDAKRWMRRAEKAEKVLKALDQDGTFENVVNG